MSMRFLENSILRLREFLAQQPDDPVARFLSDLVPEVSEQRTEERYPYICPVTIYSSDRPIPVAGYLRDISRRGVGLVHDIAMPMSEVVLRIATHQKNTLCARVRLRWCEQSARHFYLSGGEFVKVYEDDPLPEYLRTIIEHDDLVLGGYEQIMRTIR